MREQRALAKQRLIIAEQWNARHPRCQIAKRLAPVGMKVWRTTACNCGKICSPRQEPVQHLAKRWYTFILGQRLESRSDSQGRELLRAGEERKQPVTASLDLRVGKRQS